MVVMHTMPQLLRLPCYLMGGVIDGVGKNRGLQRSETTYAVNFAPGERADYDSPAAHARALHWLARQ